MFKDIKRKVQILKDSVESISRKTDMLEDVLRKSKNCLGRTVDCSVCGCMVHENKAIKRLSIETGVSIKDDGPFGLGLIESMMTEYHEGERVEETFFCKRCAPKGKKKK